MKNIYIIEGKNITDLNSLYKEFARAVNAPDGYFGKCLQSFDDCLFGGFGLEAPCEIIWKNADFTRKYLNSDMLKEYYEKIFKRKDFYTEVYTEEGRKYVIETIESAKKGEKTMFDDVVGLIESVTKRALFINQWIVTLTIK